jgi:hypothetical protein
VTPAAARSALAARGWAHLPADPATRAWAEAALPRALAALDDPAQAHQWQCEGTWFVGVDALDNAADGAVDGLALDGPGPALARALFGPLPLHRAQLSGLRPGYPRPRGGESAAAFRYRARRDAAHVDGLLPTGPERRRVLGEPHAWILGLPLRAPEPVAEAAPLVVWEGSHAVLGAALSDALRGTDPADWPGIDLTGIYQATRRKVFETCPRRVLPARPGEALLLHRHLLHGIAPWPAAAGRAPAEAPPTRLIAYFRPQLTHNPRLWLRA